MATKFCDPTSWAAFKRTKTADNIRKFPSSAGYRISALVRNGECIPQEEILEAIIQLQDQKEARPLIALLRSWAKNAKDLAGTHHTHQQTDFSWLLKDVRSAFKRKDCIGARNVVRSMLLKAKTPTQRETVFRLQNAVRKCKFDRAVLEGSQRSKRQRRRK